MPLFARLTAAALALTATLTPAMAHAEDGYEISDDTTAYVGPVADIPGPLILTVDTQPQYGTTVTWMPAWPRTLFTSDTTPDNCPEGQGMCVADNYRVWVAEDTSGGSWRLLDSEQCTPLLGDVRAPGRTCREVPGTHRLAVQAQFTLDGTPTWTVPSGGVVVDPANPTTWDYDIHDSSPLEGTAEDAGMRSGAQGRDAWGAAWGGTGKPFPTDALPLLSHLYRTSGPSPADLSAVTDSAAGTSVRVAWPAGTNPTGGIQYRKAGTETWLTGTCDLDYRTPGYTYPDTQNPVARKAGRVNARWYARPRPTLYDYWISARNLAQVADIFDWFHTQITDPAGSDDLNDLDARALQTMTGRNLPQLRANYTHFVNQHNAAQEAVRLQIAAGGVTADPRLQSAHEVLHSERTVRLHAARATAQEAAVPQHLQRAWNFLADDNFPALANYLAYGGAGPWPLANIRDLIEGSDDERQAALMAAINRLWLLSGFPSDDADGTYTDVLHAPNGGGLSELSLMSSRFRVTANQQALPIGPPVNSPQAPYIQVFPQGPRVLISYEARPYQDVEPDYILVQRRLQGSSEWETIFEQGLAHGVPSGYALSLLNDQPESPMMDPTATYQAQYRVQAVYLTPDPALTPLGPSMVAALQASANLDEYLAATRTPQQGRILRQTVLTSDVAQVPIIPMQAAPQAAVATMPIFGAGDLTVDVHDDGFDWTQAETVEVRLIAETFNSRGIALPRTFSATQEHVFEAEVQASGLNRATLRVPATEIWGSLGTYGMNRSYRLEAHAVRTQRGGTSSYRSATADLVVPANPLTQPSATTTWQSFGVRTDAAGDPGVEILGLASGSIPVDNPAMTYRVELFAPHGNTWTEVGSYPGTAVHEVNGAQQSTHAHVRVPTSDINLALPDDQYDLGTVRLHMRVSPVRQLDPAGTRTEVGPGRGFSVDVNIVAGPSLLILANNPGSGAGGGGSMGSGDDTSSVRRTSLRNLIAADAPTNRPKQALTATAAGTMPATVTEVLTGALRIDSFAAAEYMAGLTGATWHFAPDGPDGLAFIQSYDCGDLEPATTYELRIPNMETPDTSDTTVVTWRTSAGGSLPPFTHEPPAAPTGLGIAAWHDVSDTHGAIHIGVPDERVYRVWFKDTFSTEWSPCPDRGDVTDGTVTCSRVPVAQAGYHVRLQAWDRDHGWSDYSDMLEVEPPFPGDKPQPGAPTISGVEASTVPGAVAVTWSGGIGPFTVQSFRPADEQWRTCSTETMSRSALCDNLKVNTYHQFRVIDHGHDWQPSYPGSGRSPSTGLTCVGTCASRDLGSAPAAPASVSATAVKSTDGTWTATLTVTPAVTHPATGHRFQYTCLNTATGATSATSSTSTTANVGPLAPGKYTCSVKTVRVSDDVTSLATEAPTIYAVDPVGPPTAVTATGKARSVTVTWTAPANPHQVAPLTYTVTVTDPAGKESAVTSSGTSATVTGLAPTQVYDVRVTTTSPAGTSDASPPVSFTTAPDAPGKPVNVTSSSTRATPTITVSWAAPERDGGSPVTGYQVACTTRLLGIDQSVTATTNSSTRQANLTVPVAGSTYTCAVTARNAYGTSESATVTQTASVAPSAARNVSTSDRARFCFFGSCWTSPWILAKWDAPEYTGSPVPVMANYRIQFSTNGGSTWRDTGLPTGPLTFAVVEAPAGSLLRVQAVNVNGEASDWSTPVTSK